MYVAGMGVKADSAEGARWFRTALEAGEQAAEVPYATLLATGAGIPKDDPAARALFEKAAARGDAMAQLSLGVFHEEGRGGLAKDERAAFRWWKKAAEQGLPIAQAKLGVAYLKGTGTRKNTVEAYAWLAASEVPDAAEVVKMMDKQLPSPLVAKGRKLAQERRALRDAKPPAS